eukprot:m.32766 g.32766  ORF g.32766 m.32766 type:complete len:53 (-) comp8448_c0_seq2:555-713(-)
MKVTLENVLQTLKICALAVGPSHEEKRFMCMEAMNDIDFNTIMHNYCFIALF